MQTKQTLIKLIESLKDEAIINDIFDYTMMLTLIDENAENDSIALENFNDSDQDDEHFDEDTTYSIEKLTSMIHRKNGK